MAAKQAKQPTDRITVRVPKAQIYQIEALVAAGRYKNLSHFVFDAIRDLLTAQGTAAKTNIAAEKGLLEFQEAVALMEQAKAKLGLK